MKILSRVARTAQVAAFTLGLASIGSSLASAQVEVVVREGEVAAGTGGGTFDIINAPFTAGSGAMGFAGSVTLPSGASERIIWFDGEAIFLASSAAVPLTGGEGTMGVSNAGDFIYSPSIDGEDGVYSNNGVIVRGDDPAPGAAGLFITFASRPTMVADGTAHWVSGISDTLGGSSQGRILYESTGAGLGTPTVVYQTGTMLAGSVITDIDFDHDFSDDNLHHIVILDLQLPAGELRTVVVDGVVQLVEGESAGAAGNWEAFDLVSVNDSGDFIVTGDTDGAPDEFIAFNGAIVVLEEEVVDGILLDAGSLRAASLNNAGQVAHVWGVSGGAEHLFVGNGVDLASSSVRVLSTGDTIDTDGDSVDDATVVDFNASPVVGPGLSFADDGFVYVEVDLEDMATLAETEAIIRIALGGGPGPVEFVRGDCNDDGAFDISDVIFVLSVLFTGGLPSNCEEACDGNDDGMIDISDGIRMLSALFVAGSPPLPPPSACAPDTDGDPISCDEYGGCP